MAKSVRKRAKAATPAKKAKENLNLL